MLGYMNTSLSQLTTHYRDYGDGPPWPFFPIIPLFFIGLFAFFAFRYWRYSGRFDATATARRLYAEGQISEDELRQRLAVLKATQR